MTCPAAVSSAHCPRCRWPAPPRRRSRRSRSPSASSTSARKDDYGYNQAHAEGAADVKKMPGVKVVEEENVPETVDVQKTMEGMINAGRRHADLPDLVRLLRSAHAGDGRRSIPNVQLPPLRRPVDRRQAPEERRQLFRLHRRVPVPERHRRRPHHASRRSSASSPPSRSRRCCATSTPSRWARARSTRRSPRQVIFTGDWSHAGQGGRGHQQPGRPGRRRVHLPRGRPEGGRRDRGQARQVSSAATTPARPTLAPKGYLTGAEWNWLTVYKTFIDAARRPASRIPNFVRGGLKDGFVKMSPYGPTVTDAARKNGRRVKAEMMAGGFDIFKGAAEGQHRARS